MTVAVVRRNNGYTLAHDGQAIHISQSDANELIADLSALRPASTAVTPAKARLMRYPVRPS